MVARTAAILIGGFGRRMGAGGADKSQMVVGGRRIADRQVQVLAALFDEIFFVGPRTFEVTSEMTSAVRDLPARVIPDLRERGLGPLSGLETALAALRADEQTLVCVGGDMPTLQPGLLRLLRDWEGDSLAVVPRTQRGIEPLCARYHRELLPVVRQLLDDGRRSLHALIGGVRTTFIEEPELRRVDPRLQSFQNVNTPADLRAVQNDAQSDAQNED